MNDKPNNNRSKNRSKSQGHSNRRRRRPRRNDFPDDPESLEVISPDQLEKSKKKYLRRQDIKPVYFIDGTIYISKINTFLKKRTFCHNKTIGYELPKWKSIEIDE